MRRERRRTDVSRPASASRRRLGPLVLAVLALAGVLLTAVAPGAGADEIDDKRSEAQRVAAQLNEHFGEKVFRTVIPRNVRLAEAPSFGRPALFHDKESRGALAYLALAGEMLRREDGQQEGEMLSKEDGKQESEMIPREDEAKLQDHGS